jgi:DNA polymerase-1
MDKLVLVDGMYEVCRAEKAMGHLATSDGRRSGLLYGFLRAFRSYWTRFGAVPVVVWDGSPSFRRELLPEYKKESRVEELSVRQVDDGKHILKALGVAQVKHPDWEADDVMATLATEFWGPVTIITGDHDLFQVVDERITCYSPVGSNKKKVTVDGFWVKLNYQVEPSKLPELWALSGDPSDNIKGLSGVGPKTAATVVLEGDPKVFAEGSEEEYDTNLKVITVRKNLDGLHWTWPDPDFDEVVKVFKGYEFNSLVKDAEKWQEVFDAAKEQMGAVKELALTQ